MTDGNISVQTSTGRFYKSISTGLWYPSVTTVTGYSKKEFFEKWRQNPENQKTLDRACKRGNDIHAIVEEYLKTGKCPSKDEDIFYYSLFKQLKSNLDSIKDIRLQESCLVSDCLRMAGRVDCIGNYENVLSVIDFKGSTRLKSESEIQNYFEQATCYAAMYEEQYKVPIKQIVILIATEDGAMQEYVKETKKYTKQLYNTIKNFWKYHDFDLIQKEASEVWEQSLK